MVVLQATVEFAGFPYDKFDSGDSLGMSLISSRDPHQPPEWLLKPLTLGQPRERILIESSLTLRA